MNTILRNRLLASLIAAGGAALGPSIVWAQTADATLRGKAPPEMQITAKNVATGALRHTNSASDGSYALVGLPPGTYVVDAGPGTAKTITLSVASTSTLDFTGAVPTPEPATTTTLSGVSVTASTLGEVKTSEVGNTISLHQINTVPQITRNFLEFADTVPGMSFQVDAQGHTSLRGGAQNTSSSNVFIDGVGQKSYVKEGGVGGQFFSQGNPFPQLAIGEYKVITSNYKAEYDQISSAAVTAETKSGTNDFHGEVFGQYTDDGWRDMTPGEKASGKKTPSQEKEYGVALGGPIIQDTMHFFLTYEAKRYDTPITIVPGVSGINDKLPPDVTAQLGPAGKPFDEDLYFGKIDWELTDRDRIEVSSKVRKEAQRDNVGGVNAASAGIDVINNDTRIDARWQHSADSWFNELLFTWQKATYSPSALTRGNGAIYEWVPNNNARIIQVGGREASATQANSQKGPGIKDDLTFNNLNWMGDHTVKLGVKYQEIKLLSQDADPNGNPLFFYDVDENGTSPIPYKVFFPTPVPGLTGVARSSNKQFGAYIQDDWALNDRLTLNLGLRWDYEETPSYLNYVTPAGIVAALNSQDPNASAGQTYAQSLALGGVDINKYISNGHNRSAPKNEWQPRLGFSYDLNGEEQHVVFGGIGRAYDRDLYQYLKLEVTKSALPSNTIFFNDSSRTCALGPTCVEWDPKYFGGLGTLQPLLAGSNAGQEVWLINNDLKVPYSDQFSLGMRNKVWDWNTSATVQRIVSKDGFAFQIGSRFSDGSFWKGGCQPWCNGSLASVPGYGLLFIGDNGVETRSTALLLSADKPYTKESGWSVTLAYTYTHATHNNLHYDDCCAFDEESIKQYPFITSNAAPKHRFVATGSIDGPWDITFGGKLTLATPTPLNDIACYGATFPSGAGCLPVAALPNDGKKKFLVGGPAFGYRDIDFQATKNFDLTHGMSVYVRFDLLNAFNYKNYSDYSVHTWGSSGVYAPDIAYNTTGNITGVPRTFKLSAGFRW